MPDYVRPALARKQDPVPRGSTPVSSHVIATRLRDARRQRGWSRETLAHHSGISWAAIAQIESGRRPDPRVSSVARLAAALDISIDELVRGKPAERHELQHSAL